MSENSQKEYTTEQEKKDLSVVLVHYKTPGLLRQCIESIEKNPPKLSYEIIVIDNNSMDDTPQWIADDFPDVVMIANEDNRGFPKAVNQGVKKSKGSYVLLLNPDITVLGEALDRLHEFMEGSPEVGMVGPKLLNPNGSLQKSCFSFYPTPMTVLYRRTFLGNFNAGQKSLREFTMDDWDHSETKEVAWLLGSSLFVRKKAIDDIGLMDERFFMYMEDVDWARRLWENDWKVVYYPHVEMIHYYARASKDGGPNFISAFFNRQARIHIASAIKFFLKYAKKKEKTEPKITK